MLIRVVPKTLLPDPTIQSIRQSITNLLLVTPIPDRANAAEVLADILAAQYSASQDGKEVVASLIGALAEVTSADLQVMTAEDFFALVEAIYRANPFLFQSPTVD